MEPGKEASRARPRRRTLRLEPLETRSLLSVSMSATIAGTVSYEAAGGGHPTATVRLYKDGGNGVFDNGGGDDSLVGATTTGANGQYEFTNITTAGVYFVEQMPIAGYTFASGQNVATVVVSNSDLQGTTGTPIDSFATTAQTASASFPSSTTGVSYASTSDAVGGARDMYVQLQSIHGSVSLGADSTTPDAVDFSTGPGAVGLGRIIWEGQSSGASGTLTNPTGLNHLDLTAAGADTGIELTVGADHAATAVLTIYTNANDWSSATVSIAQNSDGTATQEVFVPFSAFAVGSGASGGATFSNVGAVQLDISGPAATDAQVAGIAAAGPTTLVQNFTNAAETDLAIVKTAAPSPVIAGQTLTYTFAATNYGPSNATGVTISNALPSSVVYVSAASSQGTANIANGVLTVSLGNLASGASATTTVTVTVISSASGTISNTATIAGNEDDPNMANNTLTVQTPVTADADLAITKTGSPNPVDAGKPLVYTLTIVNNGPSNGAGVTVTDTLPAGVVYASSTASQGSASDSGNVVTANLGSLAVGATATVAITVDVDSRHCRQHHQHGHSRQRVGRSEFEQQHGDLHDDRQSTAAPDGLAVDDSQTGQRLHGLRWRHADLHPDGDVQ